MSYWTQAKLTTLSNIDSNYFCQALDAMGYAPDFTIKSIDRAMEGDSRPVDCGLVDKVTGKPMNVGFRFTENEDRTVSMTIVTDFYYTQLNEKQFVDNFTIEYNTVRCIDVTARQNYSLESVEALEDGRRKIVVRRAA